MKQSIRTFLLCLFFSTLFSAGAYAQKNNKYSESYNYLKGIEALENRDYALAEQAFEKEIDTHKDNAYAYLYLSLIQYSKNEYGKAMSSINNALKYIPKKDKPFKSACLHQRALINRSLDKIDAALSDLNEAIKLDPKNSDAYQERAQLYYQQGKYDLSDADYKKMIKIDQDNMYPVMGMGRNEISRGNYQNAIDMFDNVIALYYDYSSAYSFRAEAYMKSGRFMEAASDIVKALEIDYDDKAFGLMIEIADSAFVQINAKLKAMSVNDSNNSYWTYCLGVINEDTERYPDAIAYYKKSLKLDASALTNNRISNCYEKMGDWASAIEYMDNAISLEPKDNHLKLYKADLYYQAGDPDGAVSVVDEFIELAPDDPDGYYYRGWYKDNMKDFDGAIEDYTTAIALSPDESYAYMSRGRSYLLKGETELAKKDFEVVVQKDTVPEYGSSSMYALLHLGRTEEAIEWMDKMLESSDSEGVSYEAACLYSLMGDTEKSLYYLEESLKRGNKSYHHIMTDDDIDNIRELDKFTQLMEQYFSQQSQSSDEPANVIEYNERVVEVPFTRVGGVTQVKCDVNGLPLHFIFDTGAADVTISRVEATFMFKNGYLSAEDVVGKARYMDANGDVSIGTVLNIKKITFGGLELENVRASVVENNVAPLLLGQTVLNRLGKIEIDYDRSVLKITTKERK